MFYFNFDYKSSDRYDLAKYLEPTEGTLDPLTSYFVLELLKLPPSGTFQVTKEERRIDLISYRIYSSVNYWWILLLYNDILFPNLIKIGDILAYASLENIEDIYFTLKAEGLGS